jgi:hypothetical protein
MADKFNYVWLQDGTALTLVEMPADYAYQLSALNLRLHKELDKLTVATKPVLPKVIAETGAALIVHDGQLQVRGGLTYMEELEQSFARLDEKAYPLVALLTEIRALLAQLEQWYEEDADGLHD